MIGYLDTAAFVPLMLTAEPTSAACLDFWWAADLVVSTRLLYVESVSALERRERGGRLAGDQYARALAQLNSLYVEVQLIDIDDGLVEAAAEHAHRFGLRAYDAVHCAAAAQLEEPDLVAASGDKRLLAAWRELGVATFDHAAPA